MNFRRKYHEDTSLKDMVDSAESQGATEIKRILPVQGHLVEATFGTKAAVA